MCFTVNLNISREQIEKRYGNKIILPDHRKRYLVSAFEFPLLPILSQNKNNELQFMNWGLIPAFCKDWQQASSLREKTFNAKIESIHEKPSFKHSFSEKRCAVITNGFYEWRSESKIKVPYYIKSADNGLLVMAGLYSEWQHPDSGELFQTVSIVTTPANDKMEFIHNTRMRMPAIISREIELAWLSDQLSVSTIQSYIQPCPNDDIISYTINPLASNTKANRDVSFITDEYLYNTQLRLF